MSRDPRTKMIDLAAAVEWRMKLRYADGGTLAVARADFMTNLRAVTELHGLARMAGAVAVLIDCRRDEPFAYSLASFSCVAAVIDVKADHKSVQAAYSALQPEFYQDLRRGSKNADTDPFVPTLPDRLQSAATDGNRPQSSAAEDNFAEAAAKADAEPNAPDAGTPSVPHGGPSAVLTAAGAGASLSELPSCTVCAVPAETAIAITAVSAQPSPQSAPATAGDHSLPSASRSGGDQDGLHTSVGALSLSPAAVPGTQVCDDCAGQGNCHTLRVGGYA